MHLNCCIWIAHSAHYTNKHIHHSEWRAGEANEIRVHTNLSTYFHKPHQIRDELLLMARKAVGCLVTFWLNASHAPTIDRSVSRMLWWLVRGALHWLSFTAFSSCINQTACPVHNHENVESSRRNKWKTEMKISFISGRTEKESKKNNVNESISMCEFLNVHFLKKSDASADSPRNVTTATFTIYTFH